MNVSDSYNASLSDSDLATKVSSLGEQVLQLVSAAGVDSRYQRAPAPVEDQELAGPSHVRRATGPYRH